MGKDVHHQMLGRAIGTKFASHYANISMAGLEEGLYEKFHFQPYVWLRCLDDIFCI